MVRRQEALEQLWNSRCTVYVRKGRINPDSKLTEYTEEALYTGLPCRLSYQTSVFRSDKAAGDGETAQVQQAIKLFLRPDVRIPAGCKIEVATDGQAELFVRSGQPRRYSAHQELILERFGGWA